jgi:hypothetical protein
MSGQERRRHKRVDCSLPILLYVQGHPQPIQAAVKNLSISGAFVQANEPIPKGENVLLEFKASEINMIHGRVAGEKSASRPGAVDPVTESSVVRWVQQVAGSGIGVEFINVRPDAQKFINELVDFLDANSPPSQT